jgi:hypothetical protein
MYVTLSAPLTNLNIFLELEKQETINIGAWSYFYLM